jgi:hypothetical protein
MRFIHFLNKGNKRGNNGGFLRKNQGFNCYIIYPRCPKNKKNKWVSKNQFLIKLLTEKFENVTQESTFAL